VFLKAYS